MPGLLVLLLLFLLLLLLLPLPPPPVRRLSTLLERSACFVFKLRVSEISLASLGERRFCGFTSKKLSDCVLNRPHICLIRHLRVFSDVRISLLFSSAFCLPSFYVLCCCVVG